MINMYPPVAPAMYPPSQFANTPEKHFYQVEGMKSLNVHELFPGIKPAIYNEGDDLKKIEEATRESLKNVDMSMIKPDDRINITVSEHGYGIMGGKPYMAMVKAIKEVIEERTGNYRARVIMAMYRLPQESVEVKEFFDLENYLGCEVIGTCPYEDGVAIQTRLGKFYGNSLVYDCDHMVYAYYDDPREQYLHRGMNRLFKSFVMNFGRIETRCSMHRFSSTWNGMVFPQAIYDSDFVQKRWTFATIMNTNPNGVYSIHSNNSLYECERYTMANMLRDYTFIRLLFTKLDDWAAVLDGGKWPHYLHTAGMIFGCLSEADVDFFNMDIPWGCMTDYVDAPRVDPSGKIPKVTVANGCIKTFKGGIMNQTWIGLGFMYYLSQRPYYMVGEEQYDMWLNDRNQQGGGPGQRSVDLIKGRTDTLEEAMERFKNEVGCDHFIAFDGSFGHINCSESAAKDIIAKVGDVERETYEIHLPKYLRQRGFNPEEVYRDVYHREFKG